VIIVIKGIHKVKRKLADGSKRTHYYAWRGGPRMKSRPEDKNDAFAIEYAEHKRHAEGKTDLLLSDLIDRFTGSTSKPNPDFIALADSTQVDHRYAFGLIKTQWTKLPVRITQMRGFKEQVRRWHRSYAANPRKADKLLFSLSKIFSYAIAGELIDKNPCTGIERLYNGSRREDVWTAAQIALVRAEAPPHLLLPFELAINTGQRQADILSRSWKDYDGTYLQFRQSKSKKAGADGKRVGGKRLKVLVSARLKGLLSPLPKDALRIALNSRGRPWTTDGFKTSWGKLCTKLGIEGVTYHDLRGTFISERSKEGSSVEDIAKISGHTVTEVKSVLEKHYLADDQDRSDAVIIRMENGLQRR